MVTFEQIGRKAAQLGVRILAGEDAQAAVRSESYLSAPMVDWRQLRRWGSTRIDSRRARSWNFDNRLFGRAITGTSSQSAWQWLPRARSSLRCSLKGRGDAEPK